VILIAWARVDMMFWIFSTCCNISPALSFSIVRKTVMFTLVAEHGPKVKFLRFNFRLEPKSSQILQHG
jgi:hypothetical protein